ncbi:MULTISPECIES: hypothetical protein [unclassified Sphingomonas]|uniref:hypothetical protein n=1 Tax=unclassified Sphingomonas TaxID=196159 RepID=UPI000B044B8D
MDPSLRWHDGEKVILRFHSFMAHQAGPAQKRAVPFPKDQAMVRPLALLAPVALLAALAGCATVSPEARVRSKLIEAGIRPPVAGCMAERMVDRLSLVQLKRLQSLGGLDSHDVRGMSIDELVHRLRALQDPEIVSVVLKSGIGCSIAG